MRMMRITIRNKKDIDKFFYKDIEIINKISMSFLSNKISGIECRVNVEDGIIINFHGYLPLNGSSNYARGEWDRGFPLEEFVLSKSFNVLLEL